MQSSMPLIHVLTNRHQTDPSRLADAVAIVIDVLFATSWIAIALDCAASEIVPTRGPDAAQDQVRSMDPGTYCLAAEQDGRPVPGFLDPWPHRLRRRDIQGKTLVYSTTNGTAALQMTAGAAAVYTGALVNGRAVSEHVCANHRDRDVVLICAGVGTGFALEDFYGAGYIASLLEAQASFRMTDIARAAQLLHDRAGVAECVFDTFTGRMLKERGLEADMSMCARKSTVGVAPLFRDGRIHAA